MDGTCRRDTARVGLVARPSTRLSDTSLPRSVFGAALGPSAVARSGERASSERKGKRGEREKKRRKRSVHAGAGCRPRSDPLWSRGGRRAARAPAAADRRGRHVRTPADSTRPSGWCCWRRRWTPGSTTARPTAVAIERVFAQHNVQTVMGTAQACRRGDAGGRPARRAGQPAHPERGQGGHHRLRPRRQGPGRRHGHPDPAAGGGPGRRTRPTPWPWPSAPSGEAALPPAWTPPWRRPPPDRPGSGRRSGRPGVDRLGQRAGAGRGPDLSGGRGRRPRRAQCSAAPTRSPVCGRAADDAGYLAGRPRGLAHPLRVRHRRRTGVLRAAAQRHRGGPKLA